MADYYIFPKATQDGGWFNDKTNAARVAEKLAKMEIGKPSTFDGQFNDPEKVNNIYPRFTTKAPPDVTKNTRIISICGITSKAGPDPTEDGWFVSDFLAFYQLFRGRSEHQTWFHSLNFTVLLKKHGQYLHGSPFKERKVVMNKELYKSEKAVLDRGYRTPSNLSGAFLDKLKEECDEAAKRDEPVLVLMFGHGSQGEPGKFSVGQEPLRLSTFVTSLNSKVRVTLVSTACYSGDWLVSERKLNATSVMASGANSQSRSWVSGRSIPRLCGSMFASVIIQRLTGDGAIGPETEDPEQAESMAEFARTTYNTLLSEDGLGLQHEIWFKAQDDTDGMNWHQRTGIPIDDLKRQWDTLPSYPRNPRLHPGDYMNTDPNISQELRDEFAELLAERRRLDREIHAAKLAADLKMEAKITEESDDKSEDGDTNEEDNDQVHQTGSNFGKRTFGVFLRGGLDISSVRSYVCNQAMFYLDSYPGADEFASNVAFHSLLHQILDTQEYCDEERLERAENILYYRMAIMSWTNACLSQLGLSKPDGSACEDFDFDTFYSHLDMGGRDMWNEICSGMGKKGIHDLYPACQETPEISWPKGWQYLSAAAYLAVRDSMISKEDIYKRVDLLVVKFETVLELEKNRVKEIPAIKSKRSTLAKAYGKFMRDLSPERKNATRDTSGELGGSGDLHRRKSLRIDMYVPPLTPGTASSLTSGGSNFGAGEGTGRGNISGASVERLSK